MKTAQILASRGGVLSFDLGANASPAFGQVALWTRHLEVIHVYYEEKLQLWVPKARPPVLDPLEALREEVPLAALFPVCSRIGVPVKGKTERTYWVFVLTPFWRGTIAGDSHPRWRAL